MLHIAAGDLRDRQDDRDIDRAELPIDHRTIADIGAQAKIAL